MCCLQHAYLSLENTNQNPVLYLIIIHAAQHKEKGNESITLAFSSTMINSATEDSVSEAGFHGTQGFRRRTLGGTARIRAIDKYSF
jgi:hypothetical protein